MNRLAIWQKDNAQISILHLWHQNPAPKTAVRLPYLPQRRLDRALDPLLLDQAAIRTIPDRIEVAGRLHATRLADVSLLDRIEISCGNGLSR